MNQLNKMAFTSRFVSMYLCFYLQYSHKFFNLQRIWSDETYDSVFTLYTR